MVLVLVKVLRLLAWSIISLDPGIYGSIELSPYWQEPAQYLVVRYNGLGWRAEAVVWVRYFTRSVHVKTIELPMYWPEPNPYLAVTYYLQYHLVLVHIRKIIISTLASIIY
jgi:hypothetical protein